MTLIYLSLIIGNLSLRKLPLGLTIKTSNFASESKSNDLLTPSFNLRDLNHTNQIKKKSSFYSGLCCRTCDLYTYCP